MLDEQVAAPRRIAQQIADFGQRRRLDRPALPFAAFLALDRAIVDAGRTGCDAETNLGQIDRIQNNSVVRAT